MRIETVHDKGVGIVNEDFLLVSNPTFGVFDGATGLVPYMSPEGKTGALLASTLVGETFTNAEKSLEELAVDASAALQLAMEDASVDTTKKTSRWSTSGAAVRITGSQLEWLQVGDCLILVINKDGSHRVLVENYNHDLETLLMWQELTSKGVENVRAELMPQLLKVRDNTNVTYGAFNGERAVEKFTHTGTISLDEVSEILLFTDGLFIPKENPEASDDFGTFVSLYKEGGLEKVRAVVREMEEGDPKCAKYPRFKQFDDIGAIALSF
ncbi:MAG: protein phosphatase 2C domain-containing protein [Candidatus Pacebacteria bacterium]|nr:protein phosphatase 2C domain-containing protein [Candidatus Paceibacterota bacterium]